ncbi:MAG: LptA/OstA family protein [Verrucomicrobiia bacterium]
MALTAAIGSFEQSRAQVNVTGRGRNFVAPVTDAQGRKSVLRGKDVREVKPSGTGKVEILGMQAETYRGQAKDMIVEAPQCVFDTKTKVATSSGALSIRTADGRFSIVGEGFRWEMGDSGQNSRLVISNQVQSSIRKRLIGSRAAIGVQAPATNSAPATTNAPAGGEAAPSEFIQINSQQFEYQNDVATFRNAVRVVEADGGLDCGVLAVVFQEAGTVDRIEAEREVVLRQAGTRGTADRAVYIVGEGRERVTFLGNAVWEDGARQGKGERLMYDRVSNLIQAETNAYLRLPRALLGERSFFSMAQPIPAQSAKASEAIVEVYSDQITVQLPATNGPVQRVQAEGNVLIVDADQEGRALANRAVYEESSGVLELTGAPMLEMEHRMVTGQTLRFARDTGVFTAAPDAYMKLPFQAVADLGMVPLNDAPREVVASTNRFIEIWSQEFTYRTNWLEFRNAVRANFLEGDEPRGKLTCATLSIRHGEQLESMLAEGGVMLEQFPIKGSSRPVSRRVACERLRAQFNAKGRLEVAVAELGVAADQEEHNPGQLVPVRSRLSSETVTAYFSPGANQVDRIVAEKRVSFSQDGRTAQGAKAVYSGATGLMELTGAPIATMPEGKITGAERLIWDQSRGTFSGKGTFKSEWKRAPGGAAPLGMTGRLPMP